MVKVVSLAFGWRLQPLNATLVAKEKNAAKIKIFRPNVRVFLARFSYFNF